MGRTLTQQPYMTGLSTLKHGLHVPGSGNCSPRKVKETYGEKKLGGVQICVDYGYSMVTIANHADIHYSTVSKIVKGER